MSITKDPILIFFIAKFLDKPEVVISKHSYFIDFTSEQIFWERDKKNFVYSAY